MISDRYLPSSLVLQRMDGVSWDTIWQLHAGAGPPDLAVIVNADPAVLAARLTSRGGTHSRFERQPGSSATEHALYRDTAASQHAIRRRHEQQALHGIGALHRKARIAARQQAGDAAVAEIAAAAAARQRSIRGCNAGWMSSGTSSWRPTLAWCSLP